MTWTMAYTGVAVLLLTYVPFCYSTVIQAAIEIDTGIDDLLGFLIKKFDPQDKAYHTKKESNDLATMLLKMAPLLSIKGNITDKSRGFTINFSFQAPSASGTSTDKNQNSALMVKPEEYSLSELQETEEILQPIVETLQTYVMQGIVLVIEGILGVIIARIIENACLI